MPILNLTLTPLQLSLLAHLAAHALLHLALLTPPFLLSHANLALTFIPLILSCHVYFWRNSLGFLAAVHALWSLELLVLRRPREEFRLLRLPTGSGKEGEGKGKGEESWKEAYPSGLWRRFCWVTKLVVSFRYIGWDTGSSSSSIPTRTTLASRIIFVLRRLAFMGICFLVWDAINVYQSKDTYFHILTDIDERLPRHVREVLAEYHVEFLPPRMLRILAFGGQQYAIFSTAGAFAGILPVVLGGLGIADHFWGAPENWRLLMGSPTVVLERGLRGFWGGFWHQLFRHMFADPGKAIGDVLRLPKKSILTYCIQVVIVIVISGALHAATLPREGIKGLDPFRYALFFWMQAGFVLIEAVASRVLESLNPKAQRIAVQRVCLSVLRLFWTISVLYYTVPIIEDEVIKVSRIVGLKKPLVLGRVNLKDLDFRKKYFK